MLDIRSEPVGWLEFHLNVSKCASLHTEYRKRNTILPTTIKIQVELMQPLKESDSYLHLGTPTSHWVRQMLKETIRGIVQEVNKLYFSLLASC